MSKVDRYISWDRRIMSLVNDMEECLEKEELNLAVKNSVNALRAASWIIATVREVELEKSRSI